MSLDGLRIALNATSLLSPLTGIGQYTHSLAEALAATHDIQLHLFYGSRWSRAIRTQPVREITRAKQLIKTVLPRPYLMSRWLAQPFFTRGIAARNAHLYHEPSVLPYIFDGPTVMTVHDLSWIRFPETHPRQRVDAITRAFPEALRNADHVITDAQFIREEVIREFGVPPGRITSIPLGARNIFRPRGAIECHPTLHALALSYRSFILCVGTLEPRKNLEFVVRTYAGLPARLRSLPLVIVGMKGWLTSSLESLMQPLVGCGQVRPLGFTSDTDLAALYASARMLIYPSLYEGFGLPPLEAMSSGTPVIVSNRSTLPEVVGTAGVLVDPHDGEQLSRKIEQLIDDQPEWERLAGASVAQAANFSWSKCASNTISVYRQVLAQA